MKAIGSAYQSGQNIYVLDENGGPMRSYCGELMGYTSSSISVRDGRTVVVYRADGSVVNQYSVESAIYTGPPASPPPSSSGGGGGGRSVASTAGDAASAGCVGILIMLVLGMFLFLVPGVLVASACGIRETMTEDMMWGWGAGFSVAIFLVILFIRQSFGKAMTAHLILAAVLSVIYFCEKAHDPNNFWCKGTAIMLTDHGGSYSGLSIGNVYDVKSPVQIAQRMSDGSVQYVVIPSESSVEILSWYRVQGGVAYRVEARGGWGVKHGDMYEENGTQTVRKCLRIR